MSSRPETNMLKIRDWTQPPMSLPKNRAAQRHEEDEVSTCKVNCASLTPGENITVLVADDTEMGTQLLADALSRGHHFQAIAAPKNMVSSAAATSALEPQVALVSYTLNRGGIGGLELSRRLRSTFTEVKVIVLLDRSTRESVVEAFRAGAQGVFCRTGSPKLLRKCILCVHAGQVWADSDQMRFLLESLYEVRFKPLVDARGLRLLSKREEDVLYCAVDGLKNREIAAQLHLSEHTIKNYMFRIFDKLGVSSRVEMILYALSQRPPGSQTSLEYEFVRESGEEGSSQVV